MATGENLKSWIRRLFAAAGAVVGWELGARWWESWRAGQGQGYWRTYYDEDTVRRSDAVRLSYAIRSTGVRLHVDVYAHPDEGVPVIVLNHGLAGYCRLLVPLALALHSRGYTVVLPDRRGEGYSGGPRGDGTVAEGVQNVVDVARWAKARFKGPLFVAGGSLGGALTYYAAAAAPAEAIACLNLFDLGNGVDGLQISRLAFLSRYPRLCRLVTACALLLRPLQRLRVPLRWFGAFERLADARDASFGQRWEADPVPPRLVSIRALLSCLGTPPLVPFEDNGLPVLVINQSQDRMVGPEITRRNYERLGGPKRYLEVPCGHWSSQAAFWEPIAEACDGWFAAHAPAG